MDFAKILDAAQPVTIKRDQAKAAPYNPRSIDGPARRKLEKAIRDFGLVDRPVWNRRTGNIVGGHQRVDILDEIKGGTDYESLRIVSGQALGVFHINDYPAEPPRAEITDAARVFPGDGVAPLGTLFRNLRDIGFRGMLSLELFNREYWNQDALYIARAGLEKTRAAVQKALA